VSAIGQYNATAGLSPTDWWAASILTFKIAVPPPPPPPAAASVGGFFFHDEAGDGARQLFYQGIEQATAAIDGRSFTTGTSGWYTFPGLEPGDYSLTGTVPPSPWWTPTTPEQFDLTLAGGEAPLRNFGYWWGQDPPGAVLAQNGSQQMTFGASADATLHQWLAGPQGGDSYLKVRQNGVASSLLKFDLSTLPGDASITSAKLKLYSVSASNSNRLYMSAYPAQQAWDEATVTAADFANAADGDPYGPPAGWEYLPKGKMMYNHVAPSSTGASDLDGGAQFIGTMSAEFDLDPAVVAGWLADPGSNLGLIVRGEGLDSVERWFTSREHPNGPHPELIVGYDVP